MRQLIFSLFAITLAAIAAMAATTAMLNTPMRIGPPPGTTAGVNAPQAPPPAPSTTGDKPTEPGKPATPGGTPDKSTPATPGAATPEGAAGEEEPDKDPYEGIAPEELPPDLQYSADSSVSFPTNI
jgi:hypothetical protein